MAVSLKVDTSEFLREWALVELATKEGVRKGMDRVSRDLLMELRKESPKKTGRLSTSWRAYTSALGITIINPVKYTDIVDQGARPHIITPKSAKVLHFMNKEGIDVFRQRVFHPGIEPKLFVDKAINESQSRAPQIVREMISYEYTHANTR